MLRLFAVENMSVGKGSAAALRRAILAALDEAGQRHCLGVVVCGGAVRAVHLDRWLDRLALLIRIKFITIANYCFYIFVSFTMRFQPFAYLKNCVFYCV